MTHRGAVAKWLQEHVSFARAECLKWPFSKYKNGYGQAWYSGRLMPAHRAMCIMANGAAPISGAPAAHSCGVRDCCNPQHIRWATQSENERDKRQHGTAQIGENNGYSKLTEAQVGLIKGLISREISASLIGRFYGVNRKTIDALS